MTNTKMLEKIMMVKNSLPSDTQKDIDMLVDKNLDMPKTLSTTEAEIASVILQLKNDIAMEEAKKNGKNNQLKAVKNILKKAQKSHRECLHYAKTIDGNQYICDGFTLVKLVNTLPLIECPENLEYMNVISILDNARGNYDELEIPNLAKLKAYEKAQKAIHKSEKFYYGSTYNFGENMPLFATHRLIDAMDIMQGDFKIFYDSKNITKMVMIKDEIGNEVIVMPAKKGKDFIDIKTEI